MTITEALRITGTEWTSLADLRALTGLSRTEFATAATAAYRAGQVRLEPQPIGYLITAADKAEAITIGGEPRHLAALV
jgi:hypothetical protein